MMYYCMEMTIKISPESYRTIQHDDPVALRQIGHGMCGQQPGAALGHTLGPDDPVEKVAPDEGVHSGKRIVQQVDVRAAV